MGKTINGIIIFKRKEENLLENDYSVKRILYAARKKGIVIKIITPSQFELVVTREDIKSILIDDKVESLPDFVIPRMGSETTFYAFSILRQLKNLGIYICNDADSIYAVKDKLFMHQLLAHSKLSTPKTMLAKFPIATNVVKREIGFPLIIKNVTGTQGAGIYLCETESKFIDVMELVYSNNSNANIILQEFIQKSSGRDLRVFIVGGKVIGTMLRASSDSFKANFSKGASVSSYPLTPEIEWLSTETAKLFNLDIAGIDLLFDNDGFKICEANSAPGFIGLEKVVGNIVAESIIDFVLLKIGLNPEVKHV
jgi:gamma-F420-2:alpha-L-glutamate ligase